MKGLKHFDYQNRGFLTFEDFEEAISQMMPIVSRKERKLRYKLAESATRKQDAIPLERLAQICCHLLLYTSYQSKWESEKIISAEFLATYFKDGLRDDVSDDEDSDADAELLQEESSGLVKGATGGQKDSLFGGAAADDALIEAEAAKLREALESSLIQADE